MLPEKKLAIGYEALSSFWDCEPASNLPVRLMIYLLAQALRQIERLPDNLRQVSDWDGAAGQAAMLDLLLASKAETKQ